MDVEKLSPAGSPALAGTLDPCIDFLFADGRRARDAPVAAPVPLPAARVPAPLTASVGRLYGFI